jgi:hypothetical protein
MNRAVQERIARVKAERQKIAAIKALSLERKKREAALKARL